VPSYEVSPGARPRQPAVHSADGKTGAILCPDKNEGESPTMKYADAGVNIAVADEVKQRIRHHANRTFTSGVLGGIGGFGALFALDNKKWKEPVLVSSADGVGTKLKIAMAMGVHSTVGGDLVNHCVNDILVQGATPLYFLDYLAMGKLDPAVVEQLVEGMSRACRKAGCALIGGETAEMPGFYPPGEYDVAGFIVGVVEYKKILTGKSVKPGDALLALPSSGLHTNGYSLARKLVFEVAKLKPDTYVPEVGNKIGAELLKPHLCYAPALRNIVARGWVSALAHITGGGIPGNLPRVLPAGVKAQIDLASWPVPPIFTFLAALGKIETNELLLSFNMGVGMILVVPPAHVKSVEADLKRRREKFFRIGRIERGDSGKPRVAHSGSLNL
jgi:phosphoribosylformylglycinamidine cyclo-ligase